MRYVEYETSASAPNVVVDGSPNIGTVLCITHWPGIACPEPSLADDLSAQMALRYVDRGMDLHGDADVVTNNHFDQDGLTGIYALVNPEHAIQHRDRSRTSRRRGTSPLIATGGRRASAPRSPPSACSRQVTPTPSGSSTCRG